ncbi:hypothetical protein WKI68_23525 [Streptomyces sp. MS1.HAVA.3]|uniref:Uncharacterized protein n=1 Tax=Streptomyces caledonius TaxID=3134107 RepID=A0ABU8U6N7_9ACTN
MLRLAAFAVTSALAAAAVGPLPRCPWRGCCPRPTASPSTWRTPATVGWTGNS